METVILKPSKALGELRYSYASLMIHSLYWALVKVGATSELNRWMIPVRAMTQLLGNPRQQEIDYILSAPRGLESLVDAAGDIEFTQSQNFRNNKKNWNKHFKVLAKAPAGIKLPKTPKIDRAILARLISANIYTMTSRGGFSLGRSRFSILLETAQTMLGQPPEKESREFDDNRDTYFESHILPIIQRNQLPLPMPMPQPLLSDKYFCDLAKSIRWMNPMDEEALQY